MHRGEEAKSVTEEDNLLRTSLLGRADCSLRAQEAHGGVEPTEHSVDPLIANNQAESSCLSVASYRYERRGEDKYNTSIPLSRSSNTHLAFAKNYDLSLGEVSVTTHDNNLTQLQGKKNNPPETVHSPLTTHNSLKNVAFTLAEVLITLGIIGVVAAFTLPSVISKYQEKQTVTQLNATYSLLSQAIEKMVNDNGDISTYGDDERTRVTTLFLKLQNYIQTTKVCPHNYKGCFDASPFSSLNYGYVLKNGVAIRLINGGTCEQDTTMDKTGGWELDPDVKGTHYGTYHHSCAYMYININGNTNAKLGKNTFLFAVVQNGIVPVGGPKESTSYNNISNCLTGKDMSECGAWVIYNKNMDYLHCPEQLGWDKATHCK